MVSIGRIPGDVARLESFSTYKRVDGLNAYNYVEIRYTAGR
jgi:hypothetical protein